MKTKMNFACILSLDIYDRSQFGIQDCKPDCVKYPLFKVTETSSDDDFVKKHRKYCGTLTVDQLGDLVGELDNISTCQTQGALTLEYGWLPAISWSCGDYSWYHLNVYVSPIFSDETMEKFGPLMEKMSESQRKLIVEIVTGPHFDKVMELLEDPQDCDVMEQLEALSETELDIQPMLPLIVPD